MAKTKNKFFVYVAVAIFVLAFALGFALAGAEDVAMAQTEGTDAYWSEQNKPVLYGATKITLSKNAVDKFDIKDSRFRLFAKDFEDGDLEQSLKCEGQDAVRPDTPGTYQLRYSVTDSHKNKTELTVDVIVKNDDKNLITVERTMYLIPNDWNMTVAGFSRCNGGDRQILGIYLPAGAHFDMRILSTAEELNKKCGISALTIAMLNDDARRETAVNVPVAPSAQSADADGFVSVTNNYTADDPASGSYPGNYANVPFLSSNKLLRGMDIGTTFKFEIRYDADEVHRLNYYHYKDNGGADEGEKAFWEAWQASGDGHGVLENAAVTVLVPIEDMPKLHTKQSGFVFENIDAFLEYYEKVVQRMDEIVGLSYNPEKPTDQNLRAKYIVKANAHGAGAAYYAGNHVGINSKVADDRYENGLRGQMYAFFQMNWGGLHEIAHGYQGGLGSGSMGLGEVSNNILGYYIQNDPQIYTYRDGGTWLGDIHDVKNETNRNSLRLREEDPQGLLTMTDANVAVGIKLYFLVNLFEAFEEGETYAKLFSLYREERAAGKNPTQEDFYVHFFAQTYDANVLPYFEQWGVSVSDEVAEEASKASKCYSVLADSAGDKLEQVVADGGKEQRFGLVEDGELEEYDMTGEFVAVAETDLDAQITEGRTALLTKGEETVAQAVIKDGVARFEDVPVGSYVLRMPTVNGYRTATAMARAENGKSVQKTFAYEQVDAGFFQTQIYIAGIRGTLGWAIDILSTKEGRIKNGAADLGNQNNTWAQKPDDTFMSVVIKNASGEELWRKDIKGKDYFDYQHPDDTVELEVGCTVSIFTPKPQLVYVCSLLNGKGANNKGLDVVEGYACDKTDVETMLEFEITATGVVPKYKEDFNVESEMYGAVKEQCEKSISELNEYFEKNPDVLDKKYLDRTKKDEFATWYNMMSEEDRSQYTEMFEKIERGGLPEVSVKAESLTATNKNAIDWNELLDVVDAEDGHLDLNSGCIDTKIDGDLSKKGDYTVELYVFDSDGNKTSSYSFTVHILEDTVEDVPPAGDDPNEDVPPAGESAKDGKLSTLGIALIGAAAGIVVMATALVVIFALKGKKKKA